MKRLHAICVAMLTGSLVLLATQSVNAQRSTSTWGQFGNPSRRSGINIPLRPGGGLQIGPGGINLQLPGNDPYRPGPSINIPFPPNSTNCSGGRYGGCGSSQTVPHPIIHPQPLQPIIRPQPQHIPRPVVTHVAPPQNVAPVKAVTPRSNDGPAFSLADPALIQELANLNKADALKTLDAIAGIPAANNPQAQQIIADMKAKVDGNFPITQDDTDKLKAALTPGPGGMPLFDKVLADIRKQSLTNAILVQELAGGGIQIPQGQVILVPVDPWPPGETLVVPGGDVVLVGTGGEGGMATTTSIANVAGAEVGSGDPIPDTRLGSANLVKSGVYLTNPVKNGATVGYLLNGSTFSMPAGFTQPLPAGRSWEIRFNRGQGLGEAHYGLQSGTYAFELANQGWELRRLSLLSVTIDNTTGTETFHYTVDNAYAQTGPGQSRTESSGYPILVRFNRGAAEQTKAKLFNQTAQRVRVAINPSDGLLDLYPADAQVSTRLPDVYATVAGQKRSRLLELLKHNPSADLLPGRKPLGELLRQAP